MTPQPYRAPRWLRLPRWLGSSASGHWQTIAPAVITKRWRRSKLALRRERWDTTPGGTADGDFIDVDRLDARSTAAPLVVLFHGLEGSSSSHYAAALLDALQARGWAGAIPHFRGCSGEPNRAVRAYHAGDSAEIDWILRRFAAEAPGRALYAAGVSLGGNALAKWLGEQAEAERFVRGAAVVSAPLDLSAGGNAISSGFSRVYTRMFLVSLKAKLHQKVQAHPELADLRDRLGDIDRVRDLRQYDNLYTAPVHGFRDTDDYWTRASSKPWLGGIRVPTLVLNARNDPFLPVAALPGPDQVSSDVTLEQPEQGGHVGFGSGPFPGRLDWLPQRLLDFFDSI
ncbi:alpha/beta fold hydrolase [soil metagenome]